jgi:hypothetical protein
MEMGKEEKVKLEMGKEVDCENQTSRRTRFSFSLPIAPLCWEGASVQPISFVVGGRAGKSH